MWRYEDKDYEIKIEKRKAKTDKNFKPIGIINGCDFTKYQISNRGAIINDKMEYLTPQKNKNGYMTINLQSKNRNNKNKQYKIYVHSLEHLSIPNFCSNY